jgi:hypothetical protein
MTNVFVEARPKGKPEGSDHHFTELAAARLA